MQTAARSSASISISRLISSPTAHEDLASAGDLGGEVDDAQTTLFHHDLARGLDDLRVDDLDEPFAAVLGVDVDDDRVVEDAHLRSGEPDAVGGVHGVDHAVEIPGHTTVDVLRPSWTFSRDGGRDNAKISRIGTRASERENARLLQQTPASAQTMSTGSTSTSKRMPVRFARLAKRRAARCARDGRAGRRATQLHLVGDGGP